MVQLAVLLIPVILQPEAPPQEPEEPFAIYVFTELSSEPDDDNSIARTTQEVVKQIRARKKWFRVVDRRGEADLVVELLGQTKEETTTSNFVKRTENTDAPDRQMAAFADVRDSYVLHTRVHVPMGEPIEMKVESDDRRARTAAKPFARRLEFFCRQNYWMLREALER